MNFSVMLFSSGEGTTAPASYNRLIELARFADQAGFQRIWLPERHYVQFGALHPAPAVLAAAMAVRTERLRIAAGSVVAPLHHPLEIAESWSVVDNLSNGRVDVSLASGWRREDFATRPEAYDDRHARLATQIATLREIWSGAPHTWDTGKGTAEAVLLPRPVQERLPLWLTAARAEETFRLAGREGMNLLTYLVDMGFEGLEAGLSAYRSARAEAGFDPAGGEITVMLHSYLLGPGTLSPEALRGRYCEYLVRNRDLLGQPATSLSLADAEALADAQFDRVHERLSLMGRPVALSPVVARLAELGVTELACLVDFIDDFDAIEAALPGLGAFARAHSARPAPMFEAPARARAPHSLDITKDDFYAYIESIGGAYGPDFRLLSRAQLNGARAVAELTDAGGSDDPETVRLDSLISLAHLFAQSPGLRAATEPLSLPLGIGRLHSPTPNADALSAVVTSKGREGDREFFDIDVTDASGAPGMKIERLAFGRTRLAAHDPRVAAADGLVKQVRWLGVAPDRSIVPELWMETLDGGAPTLDHGARPPQPNVKSGSYWPVLMVESGTKDTPADRVATVLDWIARTRRSDEVERLVVAVSGAARIRPDDAMPDPIAAAVWAAAGSVLRSPGQAPVRVVDLDRRAGAGDVSTQLGHALAADAPMIAVRGESLFVLELGPLVAALPGAAAIPPAIPDGARVLMTGGTGGIGPWLCDWLGEEGAGQIDLLTRDAARPLPRSGIPRCPIRRLEAPLDDVAALRRVLDGQRYDMVFHLAGDLAAEHDLDDVARLRRAFAPKSDGLACLFAALEQLPRHLVLFSSIAALAGAPGQSAYAAANAAMVAAAWDMAPVVTTLHFGPWEGGGMVAASGTEAALAVKGLRPMPPWLALRAMANVLARGVSEAAIADIDAAPTQSARPRDATLAPSHEIAPDAVRRIVLRLFAEILETEPDALDTEANLYALGFDSIMALEMRNAVQADLGIDMQLSSLMDAQSISDVVMRLEADLESGALKGVEAERRNHVDLVL